MGYYTTFRGSVSGPVSSMAKLNAAIEAGSKFSPYEFELSDWCDDYINDGQEAKWYSYDEDCTQLSRDFPNVLFVLEGSGEESGDVWKAWYRNGKTARVKATLVFEEPDLDTLLPLDLDSEVRIAAERLTEAQRELFEAQEALESASEAYDEARSTITTL